jgi:hypothetical protein
VPRAWARAPYLRGFGEGLIIAAREPLRSAGPYPAVSGRYPPIRDFLSYFSGHKVSWWRQLVAWCANSTSSMGS